MKIEVLGTGCSACDNLYNAVIQAVKGSDHESQIEVKRVNDIAYFARVGVFMTPGLVIDGKVISSGKSMTAERIREIIKEAQC